MNIFDVSEYQLIILESDVSGISLFSFSLDNEYQLIFAPLWAVDSIFMSSVYKVLRLTPWVHVLESGCHVYQLQSDLELLFRHLYM